MPRLKKISALLTALALLGMTLPPGIVLAETASLSEALKHSSATAPKVVRDVALAPGGILHGQLTDSTGQPQVDTRVTLSAQNRILVETKTDQSGAFAIKNLGAGAYQIQASSHGALYRLWAPGTAPPAATKGMLVIVDGEIQRGQFARDEFPYGTVQPSRRAVILGSLIGAAIFVPLYTGRDRNPGS